MPHRFLNNHPDVIQVILAHLGAMFISFMDVEMGLKIFSLLLAICYTCWKWHFEWKKSKSK